LVVALALAAVATTSGCSWIFVQPLREERGRGDYIDCTTNRAAPVLDTIFTLTNIASAIYVASENNVTNKGTAVTLGLSVAALWALSAGYGYSHTSECEEAMEGSGRSYYPPPRVRPRPQYYPPPPPPTAAPPPPEVVVPPAGTPGAPPSPPAAPQRQDNDEP
jgi:hypothetical protein